MLMVSQAKKPAISKREIKTDFFKTIDFRQKYERNSLRSYFLAVNVF
jgi:hypothetical protein